MSFGGRLKAARNKKRLTQVEVAEILGIDDTTISKYENDKSEPDNATLTKLAGLYGMSIDKLMGRNIEMNRSDIDVLMEKVIYELSTSQKEKVLKFVDMIQEDVEKR